MKRVIIFVVLAGLLLWAGIAYNRRGDRQVRSLAVQEQERAKQEIEKRMEGFTKEDIVVGTGDEAQNGKKVKVNYVGTLDDGKKFDSSYDRNTTFEFTLGAGEVIQGWDLGVLGMKVGGKRKLTIPASLGYGDREVPGLIPADSTLHFEVELLGVQ